MSISTEDTFELNELRKRYPLSAHVDLSTPQGRRWKRRMDESEHYFKRYSINWAANRELLCDFRSMVAEFRTYVAIAYPIINNFVADMYYRNPDPYVQDKGGDRDLGKILTDVARSVHAECDTEREMRDGFQDQSWASFGMICGSFLQKPHNAGEPIMEPVPQQPEEQSEAVNESRQPQQRPTGEIVEPTDQKVLIWRISPWRCRFDPKGRRWDMSDHRYWAYDSFQYLGDLIRDPQLTDEDRARLIAYHGRGGAAFSVDEPEEGESSGTGASETDPDFIRVCMRTIWSRPDHMVYRMPYGASFTFTPRPWDEEWARADAYPVRYMPRNRIPEDQKNTEGFIGMPDLTLIAEHIRNINKAQGLLTQALSKVLDIYVTWKGIIEAQNLGKIEDSGRGFRLLQIDPDALKKYPALQGDQNPKLKELIQLLETGNTEDLQHMAFIDHEFSLIAQIMGQGPADRGGVQPAETATQSLGEQQGIARRLGVNRADAGKHYNAITKMIFIIIQARHTLPLRYQMTTNFNEKVWSSFVDPVGTLKNIDLHFEYATGSTEARTREQEFSLRERLATIALPVFQAQGNWRMATKVIRDLAEPLNIIGSDEYFRDDTNEIVMKLLTIMRGLGKGQIGEMELTADNAGVIKQIPELIAALAQAVLTPAQLAEVESIIQGVAAPEGGGGDTGSLPKPPSPGEAAADAGARGSAAAGMQGGMQSQR